MKKRIPLERFKMLWLVYERFALGSVIASLLLAVAVVALAGSA